MLPDRVEQAGDNRLQPNDSFDEPFSLDDVEVRHRDGRRSGMARVGVAVPPHDPRRIPEGLRDAAGNKHCAHREVPRGQALRTEDEIGVE